MANNTLNDKQKVKTWRLLIVGLTNRNLTCTPPIFHWFEARLAGADSTGCAVVAAVRADGDAEMLTVVIS